MQKANILQYREKFAPAEYPAFVRYHEAALQSPWHHGEVDMANDLTDWASLSDAERDAIAGILKGFTQMESLIGDYWSDVIAEKFPKPEIIAMARTFAHQEAIHQYAYNHLESSLGLDTYAAFKASDEAKAKLDAFSNPKALGHIGNMLAIFSAAGEGVSLFGSFAILLSFAKLGKLKGMQQLISWSCRDEALHSKAAMHLYHQLVQEDASYSCNKDWLRMAMHDVVVNELSFIESAFNSGDLPTISLAQAKAFVKYKANEKYAELLGPNMKLYDDWEIEQAQEVLEWFEPLVSSTVYGDFFALQKNGSAYAGSLTKDFANVNVSEIWSKL